MEELLLFDLSDFQIGFCKEMIENNGEDALFFSCGKRYSILSVFDGCGGIGAKTYSNFSNKTGAYMASRALSGATKIWYDNLSKNNLNIDTYESYINKAMSVLNKYADRNGIILKGSLQKKFPTTAVTAVVYFANNELYADFFWAGDSRGYILDKNGLHQVTIDDLDEEDAFLNLKNDDVLKNVISSDEKYTIHKKTIKLSYPALILCATDGCFGYIPSPMHFEHLILSTLQKCKTANEWEVLLEKEIGKYASDDYTLVLQSVMYQNFKNLKKVLNARHKYLSIKYIDNFKKASEEDVNKLWNEYKEDYYKI